MTQPALFVPHGGGPCFFLNPGGPPDAMWRPMQAYLAALIASLPERPRAILMISGHWEADRPTVHVGTRPSLLFDYYGFPDHTYHLRWDAPGAPEVARRAAALLADAGFATAEEATRGWDHGVFVPMMVAVPDADIPLVQLSLDRSLDPAAHVAMGRALATLRNEGVLIVGSGMSFHNLRARGAAVTPVAAEWDAALHDAATDPCRPPGGTDRRLGAAAPCPLRPSGGRASVAADGRAGRGWRRSGDLRLSRYGDGLGRFGLPVRLSYRLAGRYLVEAEA